MNLKPTKPMSGFVELLPNQQRCFDECARRMQQVLRRAGFSRLDLPSIERAEVLTDEQNWDDIETQMYLFEKGDTKMGLRYDGTIGLARYVAGRANDLNFPARFYQFAKNYRGERPQKGRYREFYQMDADILGVNELSVNNDIEIISVLSRAYQSCTEFVGKTKVKIGSRDFWDAMFEYLNLDDDTRRQAFVLIDKKSKIEDKFEEELRAILFANDQAASEILSVFSGIYPKNEKIATAVEELKEFMSKLEAFGVENAEIDLSIMRGHGYYTGMVFEFYLENFPELGAIGGGGRYGNLVSKFSKSKIIGVGGAIGFSRMMVSLMEDSKIDLSIFQNYVDICALSMDDKYTDFTAKTANILRENGLIVISYMESGKKFKNAMEFADKINCKYSVIIGEDEVKNDKITLKNMTTGEQSQITVSEAINIVKSK
jgi:histidyl-tRNA synthetase